MKRSIANTISRMFCVRSHVFRDHASDIIPITKGERVMVSENVKQKQELQEKVFRIVKENVGFKTYPTNNEADNAFWQRPQGFFTELRANDDLDVIVDLTRDYPPDPTPTGDPKRRDLKQWDVEIRKKDNPIVRCNLRVITYGQGEVGDNKNELSISGGCFVETQKKRM